MATKIGWIVAGAFVLALVIYFGVTLMMPKPSEPVFYRGMAPDDMARAFDQLNFPIEKATFLKDPPTGGGNAADDYNAAMSLNASNLDAIKEASEHDDLIGNGDSNFVLPQKTLDVLNQIYANVVAGTKKKDMQFAFRYTPKSFKVQIFYDADTKPFYNLFVPLGTLASYYLGKNDLAHMEEIMKTEFVLCWHMTAERTRPWLTLAGATTMKGILKSLDGYEQWRDQASYKREHDAIAECLRAAADLETFTSGKINVVWHKSPNSTAEKLGLRPNPGDVYLIVRKDKDPAWRVEGLLMLGIIRYTHKGTPGDVKETNALIKQFLDDKNEYVRAAAIAAHDLSPEDYAHSIDN
jgi:hypothetical protein